MSKSIEEKLYDQNPEFVREVQGLDAEALDKRLSQLAKDQEAVQQAQEADEDLQRAKDEAKGLGAPYRESKAAIRLKMRYIIQLAGEK